MARLVNIEMDQMHAAMLNTSDARDIHSGIRYFHQERNEVASVSRLPVIVTFLDHWNDEIRQSAMSLFLSLARKDPALVAPYAPAITARVDVEKDEVTLLCARKTVEALAKEDAVMASSVQDLNDSDPEKIARGLDYFKAHYNNIRAITRLPVIAKLLDHPNDDIRYGSMLVFHGIARKDPSLIRDYVPAIAARVGKEQDVGIRMLTMLALEAVAKEDDARLLAGCVEQTVSELKAPKYISEKAVRVLRAVNKYAPNLIAELSEASRDVLTKKGIGVSRSTKVREAKPTDLAL